MVFPTQLIQWTYGPVSALGQKQTFCDAGTMSALPPKADIAAPRMGLLLRAKADIRLQSMPHYNVYVQLTFRAQARSYWGW
jgi:hypothetical protein